MLLPQNPKVVVIDDHFEEVENIIKVFSKRCIPFIYLDGKRDNDPEQFQPSVRLIVLDIDLEERTSGQNEKNKISTLTNYISKIITEENQLYYIVFWTKNPNLIQGIIANLRKLRKDPIGYSDWEKSETLSNFDIAFLESKLNEVINQTAFEYLLTWENHVYTQVSTFINRLSSITPETGKTLNETLINILGKLACSYSGNNKLKKSENNILFATKELTKGFVDSINYNDFSSCLELNKEPILSIENIAILNSILFLEKNDTPEKIDNGCIFEENNPELFLSLSKDIFCSTVNSEGFKLIGLILTPACDVAHKKFLKVSESGNPFHRVLYGLQVEITESIESDFNYTSLYKKLLSHVEKIRSSKNSFYKEFLSAVTKSEISFPQELLDELNSLSLSVENNFDEIISCFPMNKPEKCFMTEPILIDGKKCLFIFHFGTITTKEFSENFDSSYKFADSLVKDIQSKLAINVNRLGNNMIC